MDRADERDVVEAVEIRSVRAFGATGDTTDGWNVVFHEWCFDERDPNYRAQAMNEYSRLDEPGKPLGDLQQMRRGNGAEAMRFAEVPTR
jgi:hypothetical protein